MASSSSTDVETDIWKWLIHPDDLAVVAYLSNEQPRAADVNAAASSSSSSSPSSSPLEQKQHPFSLLLLGLANSETLDIIHGDPAIAVNEEKPITIVIAVAATHAMGDSWMAFDPNGADQGVLPTSIPAALKRIASSDRLRKLYKLKGCDAAEYKHWQQSGSMSKDPAPAPSASSTSSKPPPKKKARVDPPSLPQHYAMLDAHVLPFLLRFVFDADQRLFEVAQQQIAVIAVLIEILWMYCIGNELTANEVDPSISVVDSIKQHRRDLENEYGGERKAENQHNFTTYLTFAVTAMQADGLLPQDWADALLQTWSKLSTGTVDGDGVAVRRFCIISSVLMMPTHNSPPNWYLALATLEYWADVTVYPFIEVESQMEVKHHYLKYLMTANAYVPLNKKNDNHQLISAEQRNEDLCNKESRAKMLIGEDLPDSTDAIVKIQIEYQIDGKDQAHTINVIHRAHNTHIAPTVIILTKDLDALPIEARRHAIESIFKLINTEVVEADWRTNKGNYVVKGCYSTRADSIVKATATDHDKVIDFILSRRDPTSVANSTTVEATMSGVLPFVQHAFMIQPNMIGLRWETRIYMLRGVALRAIVTSATADGGSMDILDLFGNTSEYSDRRIASLHKLLKRCTVQMVDFATHIAARMEVYNRLLSKSATIRVDIGSELWRPTKDDPEPPGGPVPWTRVNDAKTLYCRFFCNEVTTSADVNLFLHFTPTPLLLAYKYVAAIVFKLIGVSEASGDAPRIFPQVDNPFLRSDPKVRKTFDGILATVLPTRDHHPAPNAAADDDSQRLARSLRADLLIPSDLTIMVDEDMSHRIIEKSKMLKEQYVENGGSIWSAIKCEDRVESDDPAVAASAILPHSAVVIFDAVLPDSLRSSSELLKRISACRGTLAVFKRAEGDERWEQEPLRESMTVKSWLKEHLTKMLKSRSEKCDIHTASSLVDIAVDDPTLLKELETHCKIGGADNPLVLTCFIHRAYPAIKLPAAPTTLAISMPSDGRIVELWQRDSRLTSIRVVLSGGGYDTIHFIQGSWSDDEDRRLRALLRIASGQASTPCRWRPNRTDEDVARLPELQYHTGCYRTELGPGQGAMIPSGTPYCIIKNCKCKDCAGESARDGAVAFDKAPLIEVVVRSPYIGDDAETTGRCIDSMRGASAVDRSRQQPSLCIADLGMMAMAKLIGNHIETPAAAASGPAGAAAFSSSRASSDLRPSVEQAKGFLTQFAKFVAMEAAIVAMAGGKAEKVSAKSEIICHQCGSEPLNLYVRFDADRFACAYCITEAKGRLDPKKKIICGFRHHSINTMKKFVEAVEDYIV